MKLIKELLAAQPSTQPSTVLEGSAKSLSSMLDEFMNDNKLHRLEGRSGVVALCTICRAIGYKDPQYFGQLTRTASIGDLINFLEDNSGAIEGIINFIKDQDNDSWKEELSQEVNPENDDEE